MIVRACPNCKSLNVHRSHREGLEPLMMVLLLRPLRCHSCNHRFWGSIFSTSLAPPRNKLKRSQHDDDNAMPGAAPPKTEAPTEPPA